MPPASNRSSSTSRRGASLYVVLGLLNRLLRLCERWRSPHIHSSSCAKDLYEAATSKCASRSLPGGAFRPARSASAASLRNVFDLLAGTVRPFSIRAIWARDGRPFFGIMLTGKPDRDFIAPRQHRCVQRFGSRNKARAVDVDANLAVGTAAFLPLAGRWSVQARSHTAGTEK